MKVNDITKIDEKTYTLVVESESGAIHETVCHVQSILGPDGSQRYFVNFDSEDFQKAIMLGHILARDISSSVLDFHRQQDK